MPILLYYKLHWKTFTLVSLLTIAPLISLYRFSEFPLDHIHYFFLTLVIAIKITFMQDKAYKKSLKAVVKTKLRSKLKRTPSHGEIINRIEDYINGRNFILMSNAVFILIIFVLKTLIRNS